MKKNFNVNNYMSIEILQMLGLESPDENQINIIETVLSVKNIGSYLFYRLKSTNNDDFCWSSLKKSLTFRDYLTN